MNFKIQTSLQKPLEIKLVDSKTKYQLKAAQPSYTSGFVNYGEYSHAHPSPVFNNIPVLEDFPSEYKDMSTHLGRKRL